MTVKPQSKLDRPALFRAIGYHPHPGQVPIHRSRARFRVVACGTRWGKTTLAVAEAVAGVLTPCKRSLGWTVAPSLDLARLVFDRVVAEIQTHFAHRIKDLSLREQRLVVVNMGGGLSELRGKTAEHPSSLLGASADFLIVDEATQLKPEIWPQYLSPRLIDRGGWALITSTPGKRDWFARLHRRGEKRRDPEYESWSQPSWTNPHVPQDLIESERRRLLPEVFDCQYGAQFIGEDDETCDTCAGPDPNVSGAILMREGQVLAECADCGWPVDERGRSLVQRGADGRRTPVLVIQLSPRVDGSEPMPLRAEVDRSSLPRVLSAGAIDDKG